MSLESVFKLSLIMNMIDNLSGPMVGVASKVGANVSKLDAASQTFGNMAKAGAAMQETGSQIVNAVLAPVEATFETRRALGELASLGVQDLEAVENAARSFSDQWAGTSKADFISAAYDIKSGIASLSDEGVAEFTSLAALTAKATKSTAGEMTSLFATGYGIYKDYYSDLSDMEFDRDRIAPSDDLDGIVREADILILATPSAYLKTFLEPLTVSLKDKFVVSAIKGIVPGDYKTIVEYIHDHYRLSYKQIGIFTGPSHAEEVSRGKLSYLTVVCTDPGNARSLGAKFATDYIHLSYSTDLYGIEYAAILKNIYALSVGIAVGLGYGDNFLAVLIANSAGEMRRFLEESYPAERDTLVSGYLGDLLVTCYSVYSRNRRLGLLIGHGCTVKSALNEMTMVAEGYFAADCIRYINARHKVDMPIADMVYKVLYEGASARKCMKELTTKLI